jgi:hypothetical protein
MQGALRTDRESRCDSDETAGRASELPSFERMMFARGTGKAAGLRAGDHDLRALGVASSELLAITPEA